MHSVNSIKQHTIAIVTRSLGEGGLERVAAEQSIYLNKIGYRIIVVTILDKIHYSYQGKLYNLGKLKTKSNSIFNKIKRFKYLKSILKSEKITTVIDHRPKNRWWSEAVILSLLYKKSNTIYVVHNYKTENYIPGNNFLFRFLYSRLKAVITVSKEIEKKIRNQYKLSNVKTIYNSINPKAIKQLSGYKTELSNKYIIWSGRINEASKNLSLLLEAYAQSELLKKNVILVILGKGKDENLIKNKIKSLDMAGYVKLLGHKKNPFPYIANAKYLVLSSNYEGFPMVVIEALACSTPVISVDCKSGPKEIISHKNNGLLVEPNNVKKLAQALNLFFNNEALYLKCKNNAEKSVSHLQTEKICRQWVNLIQNEKQKS